MSDDSLNQAAASVSDQPEQLFWHQGVVRQARNQPALQQLQRDVTGQEAADAGDEHRRRRVGDAVEQGVQIAVGSIFSASGKYRHCLRMNYAAKPTLQIEEAVRKVGEAASALLAQASNHAEH